MKTLTFALVFVIGYFCGLFLDFYGNTRAEKVTGCVYKKHGGKKLFCLQFTSTDRKVNAKSYMKEGVVWK